eukprot:CAMPEP_0184709094 /NCGR_PEP_ID=MMETSP0314-20130426/335_1 /TAXON_ID=38298 /ORGANISM="Rhodella maculata, Strain CCMP 736" /LENGTH=247 /DNA_ID=CAMNT_0027170749 /DNA_START=46 /DNA_END=789 /DNA_ORIENTATION=-
MSTAAFALVVLLGLAAAQNTCPCSANTGPSCSGITETTPGICSSTTSACSGCACDTAGILTCEVTTQNVLAFNGTGNQCSLEPRQIASCPSSGTVVVSERQCCFSGTEGFLVNCDLGPQVQNIVSVTYEYNVDGVGQFTFQPPNEPLAVTIQMTASATEVSGPNFMQPQVGTNTSSVNINANNLVVPITTTFVQPPRVVTAGSRFDWLVANPTFSVLLSAQMGESGGDAARTNTLEGCFDFTFSSIV